MSFNLEIVRLNLFEIIICQQTFDDIDDRARVRFEFVLNDDYLNHCKINNYLSRQLIVVAKITHVKSSRKNV